jgi:hypothetical protein
MKNSNRRDQFGRVRARIGTNGVVQFRGRDIRAEAELIKKKSEMELRKACPECDQQFSGLPDGAPTWGGLDAHWRSRHEHIMPYEEAGPLILGGEYQVVVGYK